MDKCHQLPGSEDSSFRLWPTISFFELRRKLLDAVIYDISHQPRRRKKKKNALPFSRPDQLSELLKLDISFVSRFESISITSNTTSIVEPLEDLKEFVADGQRSECEDKRKEVAVEVRRLAKDNADARETIARLGVIPLLVSLIDSDGVDTWISAHYAFNSFLFSFS